MINREKVMKAAGTVLLVLVALAIHQKWVAPRLSKPTTVAK